MEGKQHRVHQWWDRSITWRWEGEGGVDGGAGRGGEGHGAKVALLLGGEERCKLTGQQLAHKLCTEGQRVTQVPGQPITAKQ